MGFSIIKYQAGYSFVPGAGSKCSRPCVNTKSTSSIRSYTNALAAVARGSQACHIPSSTCFFYWLVSRDVSDNQTLP